MNKTAVLSVLTLLLSIAPLNFSEANETQIIYGAGPSTKVVQLFFTQFSNTPLDKAYTFEVPEKSVKHAGGIRACDKYIFGRTGRPLNEKEKAMNKAEIVLAQVPIAIAVGSGVAITSLSLEQLEKIVTGKYTNWKEVGGPDKEIINIGREGKEALYTILKKRFQFYNSSKFTKIFNKDHEVVAFLKNPMGAYGIAFGAEPNFKDVEGVTILKVKDFSAGQDLGLVYNLSNKEHPLVTAASEYAGTDEWTKTIQEHGYYPPTR